MNLFISFFKYLFIAGFISFIIYGFIHFFWIVIAIIIFCLIFTNNDAGPIKPIKIKKERKYRRKKTYSKTKTDPKSKIYKEKKAQDEIFQVELEQHPIHISYRDKDGTPTDRTVILKNMGYRRYGPFIDPVYIRTFCLTRQSNRTFRVDRILTAKTESGVIISDIKDFLINLSGLN